VQDLQFVTERVRKAIKERGLSANKAFLESGVGKDFFYNMSKGQIPAANKFSDLADYLDCSVDYLLGRTDNPAVNK